MTVSQQYPCSWTYDAANRLATVNGTPYTFDANGNLLNDGTGTYAYDAANRLISVTGANTSTYEYNGLGDRLRQTVNSVTTNYTLDTSTSLSAGLNAGLTQVLADGTNTYLYGNGRIGEEQPIGFAYHLPDALGSVRQLTNELGVVTLARSYEPFGSTLTSVGVTNTVFQFTGEQRDSATGLTFLRARYLSTSQGRFLTADAWPGSYIKPMSYNGWLYVYANPVNLTDPSGRFPEWCRSVNSSMEYENCVRDFYDLDAPLEQTSASQISGGPGCYSGPVSYRAPGYLEGTGGFITIWWGGVEVVYDFATMERQKFVYLGPGVNDSFIGLGAYEYAGVVFGFKNNSNINADYSGPFSSLSIGVATDLGESLQPVGIGVGVTGFISPIDPSIFGFSWSVGGSLSLDIIPGLDVGVGLLLFYGPLSATSTSYILANGQVDKSGLYHDILFGTDSPWVAPIPVMAGLSRGLGTVLAAYYVRVYEEMRDEG